MSIYRISPSNINTVVLSSPDIDRLLIDTVYTCNLHCTYCHVERTGKTVSVEDFDGFLAKINSVDYLQLGCAMEITLDNRLASFATKIKNSLAAPKSVFRLQTNGVLLLNHDLEQLKAAGINELTVSMDTVNIKTHQEMRGGSDLLQIMNNIETVRKVWPELNITLISVVNKTNIDGLDKLADYAVYAGLKGINFRNMMYRSNNNIITDHKFMSEIKIADQVFIKAVNKVKNKYKSLKIGFSDTSQIDNSNQSHIV